MRWTLVPVALLAAVVAGWPLLSSGGEAADPIAARDAFFRSGVLHVRTDRGDFLFVVGEGWIWRELDDPSHVEAVRRGGEELVPIAPGCYLPPAFQPPPVAIPGLTYAQSILNGTELHWTGDHTYWYSAGTISEGSAVAVTEDLAQLGEGRLVARLSASGFNLAGPAIVIERAGEADAAAARTLLAAAHVSEHARLELEVRDAPAGWQEPPYGDGLATFIVARECPAAVQLAGDGPDGPIAAAPFGIELGAPARILRAVPVDPANPTPPPPAGESPAAPIPLRPGTSFAPLGSGDAPSGAVFTVLRCPGVAWLACD